MARKGLRLDLRGALQEAVETHRQVSRQGVVVESADGRVQRVTLTVEPLEAPDTATRSSSSSSSRKGRS